MKPNFSNRGLLAVLMVGGFLAQAQAVEILSDHNSVALVDPNSQAGMFNWSVQGQSELHQQWFWFRVGGGGPEHSLDTIGPAVVTRPDARSMSAAYFAPSFNVKVDYLLSGGAFVSVGQTAVSDISEAITINNTSANPLDFHFFQYSDFDIGGPGGDTVQLGKNLHGLFNEAAQSDPFAGITETVVTPGANHGEVAPQGATLGKLNNAGPDNLNDFDGGPGGLGPGDVTWALQWDLLIPGGSSAIISKDKNLNIVVIPEPSAVALISIGLAGWSVWRRRRSA